MAKKRHGKLPMLLLAGIGVKALEMSRYWNNPSEWEWRVLGIESGNKKFHPEKFVANMAPIIAGGIGSVAADKIGLNRKLAFVPYVKL